MKRLIAAIDGSPSSLKAAEFASDLSAKYDADLIFIMVVHEYSFGRNDLAAYARSEEIKEPYIDIGAQHAETVLAGARLKAQARGLRQISTQAPLGDPAEQIVALAKDQGADLIVIGSRGHGQLAGLLLGSVAQKVVAHAPCPVLVMR